MEQRAYLLHALSALHAGTGQAVDVIDLPIARLQSSGVPIVPGSSVKGVLRDARRPQALGEQLHRAVFGPDRDAAHEHAGALVVSDARLLALPVRAFKGVFAWVSSPLLLTLAARDLSGVPNLPQVPAVEAGALVPGDSVNLHNDKLYLVDTDLPAQPNETVRAWAEFLGEHIWPGSGGMFTRRFAVVDDDTMAFFWETATQVDARVAIDGETRTVREHALWYEESLPPETLMVGLLLASPSLNKNHAATGTEILQAALGEGEVLQFGGKASVGRGRCRLVPVGAQGVRR